MIIEILFNLWAGASFACVLVFLFLSFFSGPPGPGSGED